jgi:hypothetical protein
MEPSFATRLRDASITAIATVVVGAAFAASKHPIDEMHILNGKAITFRGEIVETHERVSPDPLRGIVWKRTFTITMSEDKSIRESWSNVRIDSGPGSATAAENYNDVGAVLGADSKNIGWHVLAEHKLQRVVKHGHFITMITITIDAGNRCRIERKWLTEEGTAAAPGELSDGGAAVRYTPFRLLSARCDVE